MEKTKVEEVKNLHEGGGMACSALCNASRSFVQVLTRWGSATIFLFFIVISISAFVFWIDLANMVGVRLNWKLSSPKEELANTKVRIEYPLNCSINATTPEQKCATTINYPTTFNPSKISSQFNKSCPHYFRWIYEDLRTWSDTGISRETLESAKSYAHFRLVIVKGKIYLEKYTRSFQTRDVFTIWGFIQLVRFYPGKVPDLELFFRCEDKPAILKRDFPRSTNASDPGPPPPVLFQYCTHDDAVGVVFPDWSFWGWAEVNIKPWTSLLKGLMEGNERIKWKDRVPYAFWKGNPESPDRRDLMTCNVSQEHEWNARVYIQDWRKEIEEGYAHSNLEDQCDHRFKVYVEGWGWSVSEKYILACDSMTLFIKPKFYDFFTRSLQPMKHYWPIRTSHKCGDIKFAVEWGNNKTDKAQEIGRAGSKYIREDVSMENVYSFMLHLLKEYAKLLKFEPTVPPGAIEICSESMACTQQGLVKTFMEESLVKSPSDSLPCRMPPPSEVNELHKFVDENEKIMRSVATLEDKYWGKNK